MNRRSPLRIAPFACLAALLLLLAAPAARAADRPNIIVILCDDVGFCDVGCYGSEIHTPNLDALAADGLRFTQFYNTARCCPSRAALLTGLWSHEAGMGHMTEDHPGMDGYTGDLNQQCVTIPQVLKPAGYATYMVGKWHVTKHTKPDAPNFNWPIQRGFDRYYGILDGAANYFDPGTLLNDNTFVSAFADPQYQPPEGEPYYFTNALGDHACRFIREHKEKSPDKPFFMYCAFTAAHWPMHALPKDVAKYKGVYDVGYEPIRKARFEKEKQLGLIDPNTELSPQFGEWDKVKNKEWEARCMEVYAADLDCMDQNVGKIVGALKDAGQFDNTLILYMQDNGGNAESTGRNGNTPRADHPTLPPIPPEQLTLGIHPKQTREGYPVLEGTAVLPGPADTYIAYGQGWANVSNTPFREYKHFTHEGGIASPLIAHWPKHITRKGELERQPGHLVDVMATCVDVAGAQYPKQHDGHDITPMAGVTLLPAFEGKKLAERPIFWEHEGNRAVRQGDWKLVATRAGGKWELYNLATDRTELHDLISSEPGKAKELQQLWEDWAKRAHVLPWPWKPQYGQPPAAAPDDGGPPTIALKLKGGDDIGGRKAPSLVGRTITLRAAIAKPGSDGVVIAQGGSAVGYSLYFKEGRLHFALRHDGELTDVASKDAVESPKSVGAKLAKDGTVTLLVDDQQIATGKAPGLLTATPKDGLQVGQDKNGAVGDYAAPFPFKGEVGDVTLELTIEK